MEPEKPSSFSSSNPLGSPGQSLWARITSSNSDNPKPYGPVATVIITLFIYIAAELIAGLLISVVPLILGWDANRTNSWVQENPWATFGFVLLVESVTLGLLYMFMSRRKMSFRGLGIDKLRLKHILIALGGFAFYFGLYIIGISVFKSVFPGLNLEQKQELGFQTTVEGINLLPVFISLVILPPIAEEIAARGFLFGGLRTKLPFGAAALITSAMFGAAHLGASSHGLLWVAGIDTFILSLVLCFLREKTRSLWPSIIVHTIKNGLAFVVLFSIISRYFI